MNKVGMNVDDRLRAAGNALRESSAAQVDAAIGLREIVLHDAGAAAPDRASGPPREAAGAAAPLRAPAWRVGGAQRLALAVNLLLVLVLGIVLVKAATYERPPAATSPTVAPTTVAKVATATTKAAPAKTVPSVPESCLDAQELADEVISRLNRGVRDQRLFLALRDYTVASQACRRAAAR